MKILSGVLAGALLFPFLVSAGVLPGVTPRGFVTDAAKILNASEKQQLENLLIQVEQVSGDEIAVVTVPDLGGVPVEDAAVDLFKRWGIGKKGKDNGILILLAPQEREVRIEVGYGLEPFLNDAAAGRVIREVMVPLFRQGQMSAGLVAGTRQVVGELAKKQGWNLEGLPPALPQAAREPQEATPLQKAFALLVLLGVLYLFIKHPRLLFLFFLFGGGRGGRGGGGGFGGFGGGSSGGGGASGRW